MSQQIIHYFFITIYHHTSPYKTSFFFRLSHQPAYYPYPFFTTLQYILYTHSLFILTLFVPPPGGPQPKTLHKVTLRVVSQTDCRNKYGPAAPGGIIESYLCAGTDGKDSCQVGLRGRRVRLFRQSFSRLVTG